LRRSQAVRKRLESRWWLDLIFIKTANAGTNRVEVHVAGG
jgi:hypothetical protein